MTANEPAPVDVDMLMVEIEASDITRRLSAGLSMMAEALLYFADKAGKRTLAEAGVHNEAVDIARVALGRSRAEL